MPKLAPDDMGAFIERELDRVALAHSTFTPEALSLIVRSSEGVLRRTRNLCIGTLLEAVRDRTKVFDLKQVGAFCCSRIGGWSRIWTEREQP